MTKPAKLSELIRELAKYRREHGDLPVYVCDHDGGNLVRPSLAYKPEETRKREPGMYTWGPTPERIEIW